MNDEPFEIDLYQLADDSTLRANRGDGTGWHWRWAEGLVAPDAWQKEYFQGRDALGRAAAAPHTTRIQPPKIERHVS